MLHFWCRILSLYTVKISNCHRFAVFFASSMTAEKKVAGIRNQKGRMRRFLATSEGAGSQVTLTRITSGLDNPTSTIDVASSKETCLAF
jgi:hypothetical protein